MNRRQFLAALLPALCAARPKSRPLLPENSRPPDFTLNGEEARDGTGADHPVTISLRFFLGRKRIVVVFSPPRPFLDQIDAGYTDRDLVVLAILRQNAPRLTVAAKPLYQLADADGHVFSRYHADEVGTTFYLIGKDGAIKMARHGCPSNKELFGTIDAMPMRRREVRERGG